MHAAIDTGAPPGPLGCLKLSLPIPSLQMASAYLRPPAKLQWWSPAATWAACIASCATTAPQACTR
jgi:hypothetical protein